MFRMSVAKVVEKIVRHTLLGNGKGRDDEALYFHLDLRLSMYDDGKTYNRAQGLHLLYHCRKGYQWVSVFSAITDNPFVKLDKVTEWNHEVSHDSCWTDLSVISDLYFKMAAEVIADAKADGYKKDIAPADLHEHNGFSLFGELYDWVPVEIKKADPASSDWKKIIRVLGPEAERVW